MDIIDTEEAPNTYELKCTIAGITPPIWRRLRVPGDYLVGDLHTTLQTVFDWENAHLHRFDIDGTEFSEIDEEEEDDEDYEDEADITLDELELTKKSRILYNYDFGDNWEVQIKVEKIEGHDPDLTTPICLAGERAAPPDDCGGVPGYYQLVEVMSNPKHPDYEDLLGWLGYEFDPEEFDIDEINEELSQLVPNEGLPLPWIDKAAERMAKGAADADAPVPGDAEWKAFYAAVIRFRDAAPWNVMADDLNEAIEDPETGEKRVFAVLGNAEELMGLTVYRGDRGYDAFWRLKGVGLVEETDIFLTQDCLTITFGAKDELDQDEIAMLKALNLKFRGKEAWPVPRAFDPGYAPRTFNGSEARYMTLALDRVIQIAAEIRQKSREVAPHDLEEVMPLHIFADGKWRIESYEPQLTEITIPEIMPSTKVIRDLLKLPMTEGTLEIDFFSLPTELEDEAGRLIIPIGILGTDTEMGVPIVMETVSFDQVLSATIDAVVDIFKRVEMLPAQISVRRPELVDLLMPLADRLDIDVELEDDLLAMDMIKLQLFAKMAGMDLDAMLPEM